MKLGSLIALPFQGPERIEEGASVFLDPDTYEPITPYYKILDTIEENLASAAELEAAVARLEAEGAFAYESRRPQRPRRVESTPPPPRAGTAAGPATDGVTEEPESDHELVSDPIGAIYDGCEVLANIRDAAEGQLPPTGRHGIGHADRLAVATIFRGLPGGIEEIHRLIGTCSDYQERVTTHHINSLKGAPMRCETMMRHGLCAEFCEAMQRRGGQSPVAFAYLSARTPMVPEDLPSPLLDDADLRRRFIERFGDCP